MYIIIQWTTVKLYCTKQRYINNREMTYDSAKYISSSVVVWCTLLRKLTIRQNRPLPWRNFAPIPLDFTLHSSWALSSPLLHSLHPLQYLYSIHIVPEKGAGGEWRKCSGSGSDILRIRIRGCVVRSWIMNPDPGGQLIMDPDPTWAYCGHWKRKLWKDIGSKELKFVKYWIFFFFKPSIKY